MLVGQRGKLFKIGDAKAGVTNGFGIYGLGFMVDVFFDVFGGIILREANINPKSFKGNLKLVVSTAI